MKSILSENNTTHNSQSDDNVSEDEFEPSSYDTFDEMIFGPKIKESIDAIDEKEPQKEIHLKKRFIIKKKFVKFGEKIGSGQYGEVREGYLTIGKKRVDIAIKTVDLNLLDINKCKKEVLMMTQACYKHTCKVYGIFFDNQKAHLIMELCEQSLYQKLKNGEEIPFHEKIDYLIQIAKGMSYLHRNKIVHRDLKTQNIMLKNGILKITDFGTSKHFSSISGTLCGTVEYLPPEIFDLDLFVEANLIDIYSFGIVMYEILSQRTPYQTIKRQFRSDQLGFLRYIMQNKIRPDLKVLKEKEYPYVLIALMKKCWIESPSKRPQSFKSILKILKTMKKKNNICDSIN